MRYPVAKRLVRVSRRVRGYLGAEAVYLIAMCDEIQRTNGVTGSLFEIGTFYGRSLVVLAAAARPDERIGFCEIGSERVQAAKKMLLQTLGPGVADSVRSYELASRQLTRDDLAPMCRLIHIDGSHESEDVLHDLQLCEAALDARGIVIMDDVFNESYPGVVDGLYRFQAAANGVLVPVIQGFGKTVLCRADQRAMYFNWFRELQWHAFLPPKHFPTRVAEFLAQDVFVFANDLRRRIRYHLLGGYLL